MTPDIPRAVEMAVYAIEVEVATRGKDRANHEVLFACRSILAALIGTKQLPKAKQFLLQNGINYEGPQET